MTDDTNEPSLCERCGTALHAGDHFGLCDRFAARPELWAGGWVDLAAFGVPQECAAGWPEVRTGPIAQVWHGGLGPNAIRPSKGAWVRHPDRSVPTVRRVAALAVLLAAREPAPEAVAKVVGADEASLRSWCAPRVIAIRTSGCGAHHFIRVERGAPAARDHGRTSAKDRGEILWRFHTGATCERVLTRWRSADVGTVQLDVTADPACRYRRISHDAAVTAAFRVFVAATLARLRSDFLASGEPDRWLALEGLPAPLGEPAMLHESTRGIAMALVTAPPTWLWSQDPLQ